MIISIFIYFFIERIIMNCWFKYILSTVLIIFSFTSKVCASKTLAEELQQGRKVAIFNVNDFSTDADSIQAFMEALLLGSQYKDQISQYFVPDDEVNPDTVGTAATAINAKTCLVKEAH